MRPALAGALAAALLATGCGHDSPTASPRVPSPAPSGTACPSPPATDATWSEGVPDDVPLPPGSDMTAGDEDAATGVRHVYFSVPQSFTDSVKFYLAELPRAGFTLGTGDSEESEADIPFDDGSRQFSLKLRGVPDPCRTDGLLTVGAGESEESD